jgi:hypothetical protein
MSANASEARLAALTKELLIKWQQTREHWRDAKAREFDERYMLELESMTRSAITHIANLQRTISKLRDDCE